MLLIDGKTLQLQGPGGTLAVLEDDEITLKLAMLYEGQCEGLGATAAARKFGYTKQRYYQLLQAYSEKGAFALLSNKRGPKTNYRRTDEVVRQVIRHRFLDPDASAEVIAQKLKQGAWEISIRSVERIIEVYGLQKKTLRVSSRR
jgi:transposase